MKTIIKGIKFIALIAIFFTASNLNAQNNESMGRRRELAEQRFKEISDRLQLSPEQQVKLKEIAKENRAEMKQLRETKKDAPKEERRAAMIVQLKKVNDQINAMLTPKQQELFTQYKAEKKANRQKKMKERQSEHEELEDGRLF